MKYAVLFEDDPAKADERPRHLAAHLAFLEANADAIEAAGPLKQASVPAGGLWIVEAEDEATVERLVHADPFWPTGLRKSVRILAWTLVLENGRRLV